MSDRLGRTASGSHRALMQTPAIVDVPTLRFLLAALVGWLDRQQQSLLFIPHVCPDQV